MYVFTYVPHMYMQRERDTDTYIHTKQQSFGLCSKALGHCFTLLLGSR